jgi:formate dehydrogenase subunit delta
MPSDDVIRMANQIAQFFAVYPEEDAVDGVRDHLEKFWPPAMRKELIAVADGLQPADGELHPLAHRAVARLRNLAGE